MMDIEKTVTTVPSLAIVSMTRPIDGVVHSPLPPTTRRDVDARSITGDTVSLIQNPQDATNPRFMRLATDLATDNRRSTSQPLSIRRGIECEVDTETIAT